MARYDISFSSGGKGELCRGWFYLPDIHQKKHPTVIMAHGFGAVKELRLDAYAEKFVTAGFAVLVFDYRRFGSSDGVPRQLIGIADQLEDWRSALSYIHQHPGIDKSCIALWGTSFAGGHVVEIAASDPRVCCVISQVPHLDGFASASMADKAQAAQLTLEATRDAVRGLMGLSPHYVKIAGSPNELAAMSSANVNTIWPRMVPQGFSFDNRVAARIFFSLPFYSPLHKVKKLKIPWLIQIATRDQITPVWPAERAAAQAPLAILTKYEADHFDVYLPPLFDRVVAEQVEFLRNCLKAVH